MFAYLQYPCDRNYSGFCNSNTKKVSAAHKPLFRCRFGFCHGASILKQLTGLSIRSANNVVFRPAVQLLTLGKQFINGK
jgi:hypothetical protein